MNPELENKTRAELGYEPICPKCGKQDWDVDTGREAQHYHGISVSCGKCWEFSVHLTYEQLLHAVLATEAK